MKFSWEGIKKIGLGLLEMAAFTALGVALILGGTLLVVGSIGGVVAAAFFIGPAAAALIPVTPVGILGVVLGGLGVVSLYFGNKRGIKLIASGLEDLKVIRVNPDPQPASVSSPKQEQKAKLRELQENVQETSKPGKSVKLSPIRSMIKLFDKAVCRGKSPSVKPESGLKPGSR